MSETAAFRMTEEMETALAKMAKKEDRTISYIVRRAVMRELRVNGYHVDAPNKSKIAH